MDNDKKKLAEAYEKSTHRVGKISDIIAIVLILMVPLVVSLAHPEVEISMSSTLGAIGLLTMIYGVVSIVEVVSYSPYLSTGGTYLSFITGNIMNMKLPAAQNALRVNNIERGSDEADIISTLAIGASSLVTTFILFLGMLFLGRVLVPVITSPAFAPAFNNVTQALTGALAAPFFAKKLNLSVPTILAGMLMCYVVGAEFINNNYGIMMLAFIVIAFACYMLGERIRRGRTAK